MTRKWLAFDLETAKITADGDNLSAERPLGICCYAFAWMLDGELRTETGHGRNKDGSPAPQMNRAECVELVNLLRVNILRADLTLLTHNGVGFDLDILAEESGRHAECVDLAMNSVDIMFQVHCIKGFPIGLDAIAKAMGLAGKIENMSGSLAPQLWADGKHAEVLQYVTQDAVSTLEVALAVERLHSLYWVAKSGRINRMSFDKLITVADALALPEPNTGWMTDPWPRIKFVEWMKFATDTVDFKTSTHKGEN